MRRRVLSLTNMYPESDVETVPAKVSILLQALYQFSLSMANRNAVYIPGLGDGLNAQNFESHLKNRNHRAAVEARLAKAAG